MTLPHPMDSLLYVEEHNRQVSETSSTSPVYKLCCDVSATYTSIAAVIKWSGTIKAPPYMFHKLLEDKPLSTKQSTSPRPPPLTYPMLVEVNIMTELHSPTWPYLWIILKKKHRSAKHPHQPYTANIDSFYTNFTDFFKRSCLFFTFYFPPAQYFESRQALDLRKEL